MASWWSELGRRNVLRVGAAYLALTWLLLQVSSLLTDTFELPLWLPKVVTVLLALGLPIALLLAWMFEWTPEGPVRDRGATANGKRARRKSGAAPASANGADHDSSKWQRIHRIDLAIIGLLAAALAFSLWDRPNGVEGDRVAGPSSGLTGAAHPNAPGTRRVLVLPFRNLGDGEADGHFTDGLSEELMHALGSVPGLEVLARGTSFALRDGDLEPTALGARFDLDWVIDGTVRRGGDTLRITARLVDAGSGVQRWTRAFNRSTEDALRVQAEVAGSIAEELGLRSGPSPSTIEASARAQALFLEARSLDRIGATHTIESAHAKLQQAMVDSPRFLSAQALAAVVHVRLYARDRIDYPLAKQRLADLLEAMQGHAPAAPETALVRGILEDWMAPVSFRRDVTETWVATWRGLRQSLPRSPHVQILLGWKLIELGELDAAHRELAEAVQIDPLDAMARINLNNALGAMGRQEDSLAINRALLHEGSAYSHVRSALAGAEASRGRIDVAHQLLVECIARAQAAQCVLDLAAIFHRLEAPDLARECFEPTSADSPRFPGAAPVVDFLLTPGSPALPAALADALVGDPQEWDRYSPYLTLEWLARDEAVTVLDLHGRAHPELVESPVPALTSGALAYAVRVARALQLTGQPERARALLTEARSARKHFARTDFPFHHHDVVALALLGRHDEALALLQELADLGWSDHRMLRLSPSGRPSNLLPDFIADPRVVAVLDRMRAHNQAELAAIRASGRPLIPVWGTALTQSATANGDDEAGK